MKSWECVVRPGKPICPDSAWISVVIQVQRTRGDGSRVAAVLMEIVHLASGAGSKGTHQDMPAFQQSAEDLAAVEQGCSQDKPASIASSIRACEIQK